MQNPTLTQRVSDALDRWNKLNYRHRHELSWNATEMSLQLGEIERLYKALNQVTTDFEKKLEAAENAEAELESKTETAG